MSWCGSLGSDEGDEVRGGPLPLWLGTRGTRCRAVRCGPRLGRRGIG